MIYLVKYNRHCYLILKKWVKENGGIAAMEKINKEKGTLTVHYTLRDDLYWTYYGSDKKIPVTSDDFVFYFQIKIIKYQTKYSKGS